jgi:hypothetical protein
MSYGKKKKQYASKRRKLMKQYRKTIKFVNFHDRKMKKYRKRESAIVKQINRVDRVVHRLRSKYSRKRGR